jgi:hypothetical protein
MQQEPLLFEGAVPNEPSAMTMAFIADYQLWNDFAYTSYEESSDSSLAELSYDSLILKYCGLEKDHLLVAFGSDSDHRPECTTINECMTNGDESIVKTVETDGHGFESEYEYHFRVVGDRWLLEELYFLDEFDGNKPLRSL